MCCCAWLLHLFSFLRSRSDVHGSAAAPPQLPPRTVSCAWSSSFTSSASVTSASSTHGLLHLFSFRHFSFFHARSAAPLRRPSLQLPPRTVCCASSASATSASSTHGLLLMDTSSLPGLGIHDHVDPPAASSSCLSSTQADDDDACSSIGEGPKLEGTYRFVRSAAAGQKQKAPDAQGTPEHTAVHASREVYKTPLRSPYVILQTWCQCFQKTALVGSHGILTSRAGDFAGRSTLAVSPPCRCVQSAMIAQFIVSKG